MSRNVFLVDMTEHRSLEQSAVRSVQAYAFECNPELIDWFKLSRQAQPELAKAGKVFSGLEIGPQLWPQIRQRILELSGNGYAGCLFHMISYDPYILTEARSLSRPDLVIRSTPLAVLLTKYRTSFGTANYGDARYSRPPFNQPVGLTVREGLDLTKRILKEHGHTSPQRALLVVQLRPLLVRHDERARKNPRDRNSSRLVSNIIAEGTRTSCIRRYDVEGIPGTERIWVTEGDDCGTGNGGTFEAWRGNGALPPVGAVAPSIEAASASNFTEPIPPVQISSGQMDDLSSRQDQTAVSSRRELRADKGRRRTRAIEKALSQGGGAGVYSPKPQRDRLFKALRSCLPREGPPKTLLQLTREIRREASSAEGAADFPFWHPATQSFVGMLLGAGILRDELGNCVHDSLFAKSSQILSFREPLEDLCEAFLLETAISELADITESDKVPLAHALFWDKGSSDRDQVEERLEHVLKLLEGRLNVTAEGVWYIEDPEGVNERTATGAA